MLGYIVCFTIAAFRITVVDCKNAVCIIRRSSCFLPVHGSTLKPLVGALLSLPDKHFAALTHLPTTVICFTPLQGS